MSKGANSPLYASLPRFSTVKVHLMNRDQKALDEFIRAYTETFGEVLSREEAHRKFLRFVNLIRVIISPDDAALIDAEPEDATLEAHNS